MTRYLHGPFEPQSAHKSRRGKGPCEPVFDRPRRASKSPGSGHLHLWIDSDAGVDDIHAILVAIALVSGRASSSRPARLEGLSLVNGNISLEQGIVNVRRALRLFEVRDADASCQATPQAHTRPHSPVPRPVFDVLPLPLSGTTSPPSNASCRAARACQCTLEPRNPLWASPRSPTASSAVMVSGTCRPCTRLLRRTSAGPSPPGGPQLRRGRGATGR